MKQITVPGLNDSVVEIDFNELTYYLLFKWNSEDEYWTLGIQNSEQTTIIEGVKLVAGIELIRRYLHLGAPDISLAVFMPAGGSKPTRDSFNKDEAFLIYDSKL